MIIQLKPTQEQMKDFLRAQGHDENGLVDSARMHQCTVPEVILRLYRHEMRMNNLERLTFQVQPKELIRVLQFAADRQLELGHGEEPILLTVSLDQWRIEGSEDETLYIQNRKD